MRYLRHQMKKSLTVLGMALGIGASAGCDTIAEDDSLMAVEEEQAIINGNQVSDDELLDFDRAVVGLSGNAAGHATGSGILIAPRLVLTAGHCGGQPSEWVRFGRDSVNPLENITVKTEIDHSTVDLGFWVLNSPATRAIPYNNFGGPVTAGAQNLLWYGFGDDNGILDTATCDVEALFTTPVNGTNAMRSSCWNASGGDAEPEGGDSGSPLFDSDLRLVGINPGSANTTPRDLISTNIAYYMPWIIGVIADYRANLVLADFDADKSSDLYFHNRKGNGDWVDLSSTGSNHVDATYAGCAGRALVGRFNSDTRDDLLCITDSPKTVNGQSRSGFLHYASAATGSNGILPNAASFSWPIQTWCSSTGEVLVGDFNGDGRDDLFCREVASNSRKVKLNAGGATPFNITSSWSTTDGWCNSSAQLYVGKFNSDSRDDLLCHWAGTGLYIDYATSAGNFSAAHKSLASEWCQNSGGARLYTGDFNNDTWTDLYCWEASTNRMWIDKSNKSSTAIPFSGTDVLAENPWCAESVATLDVADLNGDGYADLACYDYGKGITYANLNSKSSTEFPFGAQSSWHNPNSDAPGF